MPNLGNIKVYDAVKNLILHHLIKNGITELDIINRILGTLNVLHVLNRDYDRFVRIGDLILEGKITRNLWRYPERNGDAEKTAITLYSKEFGFANESDFLNWLKELTPNPSGLAPNGYVHGGLSTAQKAQLIGDKFDIHLHKGEFISTNEQQSGVVRLAQFGNSPGKPMPTWADSIKKWTQDFLQATTFASEFNIWSEFATGLSGLPCGQGRFWPLEKFVEKMKSEKSLTDGTLNQLSEKLVPLSSLLNGATISLTPVHDAPITSESVVDTTFKMTGPVPNKTGFCIIADYLSQKHKIKMFVAHRSADINKLLELMTNPQVPVGVKVGVLGMTASGHWFAMQVQKKPSNALEVAVMDSLGDGEHARSSAFDEISHLISNFIEAQTTFKNVKLYYNQERMQFDPENCGTFSAKFCKKMLKSPDFVGQLKAAGNLLEVSPATLEKADFAQLFSVPEIFYFNQYQALGGKPREILQTVEKQFAHVKDIQSDVLADRFTNKDMGGVDKNPYHHIYKAVIAKRAKYWTNVIEQYILQNNQRNLAAIIERSKLENLKLEDIVPAPQPVAKAVASRPSLRPSSFNYREYMKLCGGIQSIEVTSPHGALTVSDVTKAQPNKY